MAIQFDLVGNDHGVVKTFEDIQSSVKHVASVIEELGKSKDIDGLANQVKSLQEAIRDNEQAIETSKEKLKQFAKESKAALDAGDISTFNAKQADYSSELDNLKDLIEGTKEYKQALEELTEAKGLVSQEKVPQFFESEEDFEHVKELREKIAELQEQIGNFNGSDEELYALREALSDTNDELREAEESASDAAQSLGPELGKKAAETSAKLYEMNEAVKEQEEVVEELRQKYNEAAEAMNALEGSDDTAAKEKALSNYEMLAQQLQNAENHLTNLKNAQVEAQKEWKKTSEEVDRHNSIITKLCGGEEKLNEIMDHLPGPLQKAVKGLEGMTGAAKAFIATPLGAVLAALIVAWQTLNAWFERSEEGQMALAKISGYLSGVLDALMDVVASVGEALYKAFTNPKEAAKSFVYFLRDQVVNRLKAVGIIGMNLGKILADGLSGNFGEAKQAFKDMMQGAAQFATGIEKPLTKAKNAIEEFHKKATESSNIAVENKQLEREEAQVNRQIAELEKREGELRAKRGKRTKDEENELKDLEKKITDANVRIIDKKIELQERAMKNSTYDSIEENNKLDELYAQRERIVGRANQRLAQIEMQGMSSSKSAQKEAEKQSKERAERMAKDIEARIKQAEEIAQLEREAKRAQEDAAIAAIRNQAEREHAEREIQHKRTIEDLKAKEDEIYKTIYEQRKRAYENANKGKKYENDDLGKLGWGDNGGLKEQAEAILKPIHDAMANLHELTAEEIKKIQDDLNNLDLSSVFKGKDEAEQFKLQLNTILSEASVANTKVIRENEERTKQLIASHQSYVDKKKAIDEDYAKEAAKIDAAIAEAEQKGDKETVDALKRSRAELEKERAKSQADLSLAQLKEMPEYIRAFEDLDKTSTGTLQNLIKLFKDARAEQAATLTPDQYREWTNTIEQMEAKIRERNPFDALKVSHQRLKIAQENTNKALKVYQAVQKGVQIGTGKFVMVNGKAVEVMHTQQSALEALNKARDEELELSEEEKKSFENVRKYVDELANAISNLGSAIGGEAGQILNIVGSVMTFTTSTIESVKKVIETVRAAKTGIDGALAAIESASVILSVISAAWQIGQQIASLFGESEEEKQARLKREEMMRNMTSSVQQYRLEVIKARQEEDTWFASSSIKKLAQQWEMSSEAQKAYFEIAKKQTEQLTEDIKKWNVIYGSNRYNFYHSYTESIKEMGHAFDMEIQNEKDQLETLSSFIKRVYGDEMFKDGMLNTTAIDQFLSDYSDRIQHDDEQILKNLNEMAKQYQEWQKALQDYVDEQYGGLSDDIVDALWSWYDEGTDVLDSFRDSAKDTFRGVASDMMKELVNSIVFDELKKKLTDAFTIYSTNVNSGMDVQAALSQLSATMETALSSFEVNVESALPTLQGFMTQIGEMSDRLFGTTTGIVTDYFDDIRNAWTDVISGMESDSEKLGKEMARIMFENLVNTNVFNKEFDDWLKDFSQRYEAAVNANPGERAARLAQLEEERKNKVDELTRKTKEYAEAAGYAAESDDEFTTSLSNLSDTLLDNLLDAETDAAKFGNKIAQNLIREMLQTLLATEKYASKIEDIKKQWQEALNFASNMDAWEADWNKRYQEALNASAAGEREARLAQLEEERNQMLEKRKNGIDGVKQAIVDLNNEIAGDDQISSLVDNYRELEESVDDVKSSFGDLHSSFMDAITDMENGADNFKKKLNETLTKDLIEKNVFNVPITLTIDNEEKTFDNFDEYVDDWTKRYLDALENGDEALLATLIKEMEEREAAMATSAEGYAQALKKAEVDTTFTSMESSFVSALMDMNTDVKDFANNLKKTIVQRLVESFMVSEKIKPLLEDLQKTFDYAISLGDATKAAEVIAVGYVDEVTGEVHKGINDVADAMTPMQQLVNTLLTSIGYEADKTAGKFDNLGNTIKNALMSASGGLESFVDSLKDSVANELMDAYMATEKVQTKLTDIKKGLSDATERVASANERVANAEAAKAAAKTRSQLSKANMELRAAQAELKAANEQLELAEQNAEDFYNEIDKATESITATVRGTEQLAQAFDDLESRLSSSSSAEDFVKAITDTIADEMEKAYMATEEFQKKLEDVKKNLREAMESGDPEKIREAEEAAADLYNGVKSVSAAVRELNKESDTTFTDMANDFINTLMDVNGDIEDFANNMKETIARKLVEAFMVSKYIQPILDELQETMDYALTLDDVNEAARIMAEGYTDAFGNAHKGLNTLTAELAPAQEAVNTLLTNIGWVNKAAEEEAAKAVEEAAKAQEEIFKNLGDSLVSHLTASNAKAEDFVSELVKEISKEMVEAYVTTEELGKKLTELKAKMRAALESGNETFINNVKNEIKGVIDETEQGVSRITAVFKDMTNDTTFSGMGDSIVSALTNVEGDVENVAENMKKTIVDKLVKSFMETSVIKDKLNDLQETFNEVMGSDLSMEAKALRLSQEIDDSGIQKEIENERDAIIALMKKMGFDIKTVEEQQAEEAAKELEEKLKGLGDTIISALSNTETTAKDFARSITEGIVNELIEGFVNDGELAKTLDGLKEKLKDAIGSGDADRIKAARDEIEKFYNTAMSGVKGYTDALKEAEEAANDTTFTGLADSWASTLMEMDKDATYWAENVGKMMAQKVVEQFVVQGALGSLLSQMQAEYDKVMKDPAKNWKDAVAALKPLIETAKNEMPGIQSTVTEIMNEFGISLENVKEGFSDLKGSFVSTLLDMESDADKFGKEIAKNMIESMVDKTIEKELGEKIAQLNADWYDALENNDTTAMEDIKKRVLEIRSEAAGMTSSLIEMYKKLQDTSDETMTSMRDSFLSALMDMSAGSADFAKDIRKTLSQKLIEKFVMTEEYDKWLKDIQEKYNEAFNGDYGVEEMSRKMTEIANEWTQKATEMQEETNRILTLTGVIDGFGTAMKEMRDSWSSMLMDMDASTNDFVTDLRRMFSERLIDKYVLNDSFDSWLDEMQRQYDAVMSQTLDEDTMSNELDRLATEWGKKADELKGKASQILDMTGLSAALKEVNDTITSMKDGYLSALMDMSAGTSDFANDITKTLTERLVQKFVLGSEFDTMMASYQKQYEEIISNTSLSEKEMAAAMRQLSSDINSYAADLQGKTTAIFDATGWQKVLDRANMAFSDLSSMFLGTLTDMESDAESFRDSINEKVFNDLIEKKVLSIPITIDDTDFENFEAYAEKWNEDYAAAVKSGNDEAVKALIGKLVEVREQTMESAEALRKEFGKVAKDTTFTSLSDTWVSTLMDMNNDAEKWAENIGRVMAEKIIQQMIVPTMMQPLLDKLQDVFDDAMEKSDGNWKSVLGSEEVNAALTDIKNQYPNIQSVVKDIMDMLYLDTSVAGEENPFSDMRSRFVSSLTDMEADAEAFAKDVSRILAEQMIDKVITDRFQPQIDDLGRQWALALERNDKTAIDSITQKLTDLREKMGGAVKPLLEAIKDINKQTDTTFTSMRDSWVSALMDMEGTAEQFAENVGKTMAQKILLSIVAPKLIDPLLEKMQDTFNEIMDDPKVTIAQATSALKPYLDEIEKVYNEIIPMRDQVYNGLDLGRDAVEEAVEEVEYALQDMKSNFVSSLMDMSSSTEDFSKSISQAMAQNFIENFVLGQKFDQQMEYWQRQYEGIISSGLSDTERKRQLKQLRDTIASAKEGYVEEARAIQELLGLTTGHEDKMANVTAADKVTYDQMDEFTGILRAIQIAGEQRNDLIRDIRTQMGINTLVGATGDASTANAIMSTLSTMSQATSSGGGAEVKEIRNMMIYTNQYLLDIQKSNRSIYNDFGYKMDRIIDKLDDIG